MILLGQDSQILYGEMIERVIKLEDPFVFKLDIDSAPFEEPIVASLLGDNAQNGGAIAHQNRWLAMLIRFRCFSIT